MKATGIFISTLLVIDAFLGGYAAGFNSGSRKIYVIDPELSPLVQESKPAPTSDPKEEAKAAKAGKKEADKNKSASQKEEHSKKHVSASGKDAKKHDNKNAKNNSNNATKNEQKPEKQTQPAASKNSTTKKTEK